MASGGNNRDVEDALSKLLQRGMVDEYQNEFEMLISRRVRPTTLGEAFSLAHITEVHFEAIAEQNIKEKADTTLSLPSEEATYGGDDGFK
ncbi:hypothetical protein Tco_0851226 [Tanacetum coccineum]